MPALAVPLPKSINRLVARYPAAREAVVDEAVRVLRSRSSFWPVATGRSIRAFRRSGSGSSSRVYNPVRYASYVEARNKPAERTLQRFRDRLRRVALEARNDPNIRRSEADRAQEATLNIIRAAAARQRWQEANALYELYLEQYSVQGRAPRIPRWLRRLSARIAREANRQARRSLD